VFDIDDTYLEAAKFKKDSAILKKVIIFFGKDYRAHKSASIKP